MDCNPPDSSVHGILQARIQKWVAISSSRGSSWPRDWTQVSCIAGRFFSVWASRKAHFGAQELSNSCWKWSMSFARFYCAFFLNFPSNRFRLNCIDRFVLGNVSKKEVTQSPKKRIYWDRGVVFCFVLFFPMLQVMCDPSSPTRDRTHVPFTGSMES